VAYILGRKVFLDDFRRDEYCVEFNARASVAEINGVLSCMYGEGKKVGWEHNFSEYDFGAINVKYILNGKLNVKISSEETQLLDKLEDMLEEL